MSQIPKLIFRFTDWIFALPLAASIKTSGQLRFPTCIIHFLMSNFLYEKMFLLTGEISSETVHPQFNVTWRQQPQRQSVCWPWRSGSHLWSAVGAYQVNEGRYPRSGEGIHTPREPAFFCYPPWFRLLCDFLITESGTRPGYGSLPWKFLLLLKTSDCVQWLYGLKCLLRKSAVVACEVMLCLLALRISIFHKLVSPPCEKLYMVSSASVIYYW